MEFFKKVKNSERYKFFIEKIDNKYPFTFIDIGAIGGIPLKWRGLAKYMKIIAFEPDTRESRNLKSNHNIRYFDYALHDKSEDLKFYITSGYGKSSIFKPNLDVLSRYEDEERFKIVKEVVIDSARVRSLDSFIEENSLNDIDFIKIDTQGCELLILQGGRRKVIPMVFGIQAEVEFVEMYKNQPLFRDIDEFMESSGLQLIDLKRLYWKRKDYYNYNGKGQLIFGDALYFKKINILFEELSETKNKVYTKSKIFKSILTCLIYRMFDYAVSIAKMGFERKYFTSEECEAVISEIKRHSSKINYLDYYLNLRLYDMATLILRKFKLRSHLRWLDSDRDIGNVKDI